MQSRLLNRYFTLLPQSPLVRDVVAIHGLYEHEIWLFARQDRLILHCLDGYKSSRPFAEQVVVYRPVRQAY